MHIFYKRLRSNAHYGNNLVFAQKERKNSILAKRIRERIQKGCKHKTYTRKSDTIAKNKVKMPKRISNDCTNHFELNIKVHAVQTVNERTM